MLSSNSCWGLRAPDPANPNSEKLLPSQPFFCCTYFSKSVIKLHRLFHTANRNKHFDMFFKIKACIGVNYFLVCVRKHESNLPTNMLTTVGKKTQRYAEKMRPFECNHNSALFYNSVVCFLVPKFVCVCVCV